MQYLEPVQFRWTGNERLCCVALAHNEGLLLPHFLQHYRSLGVDHFFVVDDRSTDGTRDILASQDDVSIFTPVANSSYSNDKRHWRAEILDAFLASQWVVVPDIDEHLVLPQSQTIPELIEEMTRQGALALHATMVDMYADKPISTQKYTAGRLIDSFPLFDAPETYFRVAAAGRFKAKYPTPSFFVIGGMRQRVFHPMHLSQTQSQLLARLGSLGRNNEMDLFNALRDRAARAVIRSELKTRNVLNNSKIPVLKWVKGMHFYNGAHAISKSLPLFRKSGALLHFKLAGGLSSIEYNALRGQHTGGGKFYKETVSQLTVLEKSPIFNKTSSYVGPYSLGSLLE